MNLPSTGQLEPVGEIAYPSMWTLMWLFNDTDLTVYLDDRYLLDVNGDGEVDVSDPIYLLSSLFLGGAKPKCLAVR